MNQHSENIIKELRMLYSVLVAGMVFFILLSLMIDFLGMLVPEYDTESATWFLIISNVAAVLILGFAFGYFKRQLPLIREKALSHRLEQYKVASLIRAAAIESAVFLFLIFYIYTSSAAFLAEALLVFLLIVYFFPNNKRISKDIDD